jgi:hypothetical protein
MKGTDMTTYSEEFSPLIDSHVHLDVTAIKRDSTHTTFVFFLFVKHDINSPEMLSLFGADHNVISVPNHRANDCEFVISVALDAATMQIGDTDSDFFDNYTQDELDFANSWLCEALSGEYEYS